MTPRTAKYGLVAAGLMNIGGVLHRQRSGIKTIHLAEILASTEKEVAVA